MSSGEGSTAKGGVATTQRVIARITKQIQGHSVLLAGVNLDQSCVWYRARGDEVWILSTR